MTLTTRDAKSSALLVLLSFLALPVISQAQYGYTVTNGQATITSYSGPGGAVTIPSQIDGLPVTGIGDEVFIGTGLTSVAIPNGVTSIGSFAFTDCRSLTNITFPNSLTSVGRHAFQYCSKLPGVTLPDSLTNIGERAFHLCFSLTNLVLPNRITSLADYLFENCANLASVTIPNSVTNIGGGTFYDCTGLTSVFFGDGVTSIGGSAFINCTNLTPYFLGNAPVASGRVFGAGAPFGLDPGGDSIKVYYLPGTTGWGATFSNRPTALWSLPNPVILGNGTLGVRDNRFGFTISWAAGNPVVVESAASLGNPVWSPVSTNILTGGSAVFSDPQLAGQPARFYRVRPQ